MSHPLTSFWKHAELTQGKSLTSNSKTAAGQMLSSSVLSGEINPLATRDWMNAAVQVDGNFVVYYVQAPVGFGQRRAYAKWSSNSQVGKNAGPFTLTNHGDNLILYNGAGNEIWRAPHHKAITKLPCTLVMQDDGNLVYYDANRVAVWASNTNGQTHP